MSKYDEHERAINYALTYIVRIDWSIMDGTELITKARATREDFVL